MRRHSSIDTVPDDHVCRPVNPEGHAVGYAWQPKAIWSKTREAREGWEFESTPRPMQVSSDLEKVHIAQAVRETVREHGLRLETRPERFHRESRELEAEMRRAMLYLQDSPAYHNDTVVHTVVNHLRHVLTELHRDREFVKNYRGNGDGNH